MTKNMTDLVQEITGRALYVALVLALMAMFLILANDAAFGQEGPPIALQGSLLDNAQFKGQLWSYTGTFSPLERNNVLSNTYAEQTVSLFSTWNSSLDITPYAAIGFSFDTKGNPWNRSIQPSFGVKANKFFRHGVISTGVAYSYQDRFGTTSANGGTNYILDWFGWSPIGDKRSRFPGSTWAVVGHTAPVEQGNLIAQTYLTQGYVLRRFDRSALIPYGEITYSRDTKKFDWENKILEGAGVKYGMPMGELYVDVGAGYMHEQRFESNRSGGGAKIFMDISYAWGNLFGRKDERE